MMYECLKASISEEAKSALASRDQEFHEDGPSLFYHMVSQLFTATFSNTQATRDNLADFHPKQFRYDVIQVSNYISSAVMTLKAASSAGGTIMDQETLYFQFKSGRPTSYFWSPQWPVLLVTHRKPFSTKHKPST